MDERVYDPVFASTAGLKSCPACDKAAPNKCQFHAWVDRKLDWYKRIHGPQLLTCPKCGEQLQRDGHHFPYPVEPLL